MKKLSLERYAPPGVNLKTERNLFICGMVAALLWSFSFFNSFSRYKGQLYYHRGDEAILREGAVMEDFVVVLDKSLLGFLLLAFCLIMVAVYHYAYHYQDSKSIYLMRRLPDNMELHRRCLTLPAAAIVIALLTAFVLLLIYYAVYMLATPPECLTPDQWQKLWR